MSPDIRPGKAENCQSTDSEEVTQLFRRGVKNDRLNQTVISTFENTPDVYVVYLESSCTRSITITDEREALRLWEFYDNLYAGKNEVHVFSFPTRQEFVMAAKIGLALQAQDELQTEGKLHNTNYVLKTLDDLAQ